MVKTQDVRSQMPGGNSKRNISQIKNIARHHSATTEGTAQSFANYHVNHHGWNTSGYHEVILRDGTVQIAYDDNVVTNGVGGHNTPTYHICVVGSGSFTDKQEEAFEERAKEAMSRFGLDVGDVLGHNEFSNTNGYSHSSNSCPGIDMDKVRGWLGGSSTSNSKPSTSSSASGRVESKVNGLRFYSKPSWSDSDVAGRVDEGIGFPNIVRKIKVGNGYQYEVKNSKGATYYITAASKYVTTTSGSTSSTSSSGGTKLSLPTGVYSMSRNSSEQLADVKLIQAALNAANFNCGEEDGYFGAKTDDALRRFQSVYLPYEIDGVYGQNSRRELDKVVNG
ncbi:N-acetylmuramoyl-L-alanine amidase CwlA [Virgibacillus natechei]|uniref:Autolysin n=1 Tax=Virgibacillus natechei TaxID=1216297 RepID=A0ABS4IBX5_9BACI|nr:N-acetylmuramoyl-L-alanine amidase [Virgibacillus natechei]MBP1967961.1 N-acetylmuramoyl-L-alanine amidase CwlA [Virgibacillus natechei]UZD14751.1 N-acetylmuramoyl-L-alanine amidase [Virgibacillus natechei]